MRKIRDYIAVLKPRESSLLTFIGVCAAIIAGQGVIPPSLPLVLVTLLVGSAGLNGLTNYLDRNIDHKMKRTWHRVLPSKRIDPAYKVLLLTIPLVIIGLALAWQLHPFSFIAGLVGTVAAAVGRKKWTCVFPQGILASCAPVVIGWMAVDAAFSWPLLLLCLLIALWLPIHLWSVMITHREDYLTAGISYFPLSMEIAWVIKVLSVLGLALYAVSLVLYFVAGFSWLYLVLANVLGSTLIYTSLRLVVFRSRRDSWKLYKISAFPYLGLIFLAMCLDARLISG